MLSLWRPSSAEAAPMHDVEAVEHDEKVVSLAMEITDAGMQLSNSSTEAELFMIYSITGQLVKKISVAAGSKTVVSRPGGCYVVRCRVWAKKTVVR